MVCNSILTPYSFFGVHFTAWCPLGCQHCFTNSSPRAEKQTVNIDLAESLGRRVLRRTPDARLVVTGGEPLVFKDSLLQLLKRAHLLEVETSLHTNGFWGGLSWATEALGNMMNFGLTLVNLSADDYHARRLPLKKVGKAARTVISLGLELRLLVTYGEDSAINPSTVLEAIGLSGDERIEIIPVNLARSGGAEALESFGC